MYINCVHLCTSYTERSVFRIIFNTYFAQQCSAKMNKVLYIFFYKTMDFFVLLIEYIYFKFNYICVFRIKFFPLKSIIFAIVFYFLKHIQFYDTYRTYLSYDTCVAVEIYVVWRVDGRQSDISGSSGNDR